MLLLLLLQQHIEASLCWVLYKHSEKQSQPWKANNLDKDRQRMEREREAQKERKEEEERTNRGRIRNGTQMPYLLDHATSPVIPKNPTSSKLRRKWTTPHKSRVIRLCGGQKMASTPQFMGRLWGCNTSHLCSFTALCWRWAGTDLLPRTHPNLLSQSGDPLRGG